MRYAMGIHLQPDDEICIDHIGDCSEPYARLKFGGIGGTTVYASTEQVAELHRLTGEYLDARRAEQAAHPDPEIMTWEGEGGQAAVAPLCPDSPDGKHHGAPIGSEEDLTLACTECWYCGEKATKHGRAVAEVANG